MKTYRDELTGELFQLEGGKLYLGEQVVADTPEAIEALFDLNDLEEVK